MALNTANLDDAILWYQNDIALVPRMLTPKQLDQEYNARAAIPDHPQIFNRWREESALARNSLQCHTDLRFGPSPAESLDLFLPDTSNAPLLVFIHGGYWRALDKQDFSFLAPAFVQAGVAVAMPNYGLAPETSLKEMVLQMLRALAWLYHNPPRFDIDRRRIVVAGHSAGAHLAAMMLAADWPTWSKNLPSNLLSGTVCISGLYDLQPLARAPFLRKDIKLNSAQAQTVSPNRYLPKIASRLITAVGEDESTEFKRQNRLIAEAWPHCFFGNVPLPGRHHLSAVEALGDSSEQLFETTLKLLETSK